MNFVDASDAADDGVGAATVGDDDAGGDLADSVTGLAGVVRADDAGAAEGAAVAGCCAAGTAARGATAGADAACGAGSAGAGSGAGVSVPDAA